jgi:hypothetical protein
MKEHHGSLQVLYFEARSHCNPTPSQDSQRCNIKRSFFTKQLLIAYIIKYYHNKKYILGWWSGSSGKECLPSKSEALSSNPVLQKEKKKGSSFSTYKYILYKRI